jgi:hypothetical protein
MPFFSSQERAGSNARPMKKARIKGLIRKRILDKRNNRRRIPPIWRILFSNSVIPEDLVSTVIILDPNDRKTKRKMQIHPGGRVL